MLTLRKCQSLSGARFGVDTGAGKTAWLQNVTRGKTILGESDLVFPAQQLENLSSLAKNCASMVVTIGEQISEFLRCSSAGV